jgi:hypothetical protein
VEGLTGNIVYYAILREGDASAEPSGLARRTFTPEGRLDETLRRDLSWGRDSAIYEWERGEEMGARLVEISEAEAGALVERFREKWSGG